MGFRHALLVVLMVTACAAQPTPDCSRSACPPDQLCNSLTRRCEANPSTGGGSAGGVAGGSATTAGGTAGGADGVTAWTLEIDLSEIRRELPASCYRGGVVPSSFPAGPTTASVQAVVFEGRSFDVAFDARNGPRIKMGDAPTYTFPDAIIDGTRAPTAELSGERRELSYGPGTRYALETRVLKTRMLFTRSGDRASGALTLDVTYECVDNGVDESSKCPTGSLIGADAASCVVSFPFTAQRLLQLPSWAQPATPSTAEAFAFLLDERFVDDNSCYASHRVPQPRVLRKNERSFHTIQRAVLPMGSALRLSLYMFKLADSPLVMIDQPLVATGVPNEFLLTRQTVSLGPLPQRLATETRSSMVTMTLDQAAPSVTLRVWSSYQCVDSGPTLREQCPRPLDAPPAPDSETCLSIMMGRAHRLP